MSLENEKKNRKELLHNLKKQQQTEFENGLPMKRVDFQNLFDYLDEEMVDCDDSLMLTEQFLSENQLAKDQVVKWLNANGAFCDCEVLGNVEEQFD